MRKKGFTLVEMLVTLSLFGMAMAVLLAGLQTGIRGWRTLARHHAQEREIERTRERLRADIRQLSLVSEDVAGLSESRRGDEIESISLCVLESRLKQRCGRGAVWNLVTYSLRAPREDEPGALYRRSTPCIAGKPLEADASEERLLGDVRTFSVTYVDEDGVRADWKEARELPGGIRVDLVVRGHRTVHVAGSVACAWKGAGAS